MVPNDTMLDMLAPPTAPDLVGEFLSGGARNFAPRIRHQSAPDVGLALRARQRALFEPRSPSALSRLDRQAVGLRVAVLNAAETVAAEYRRGLRKLGAGRLLIAAVEGQTEAGELPGRLRAILDYAAHCSSDPRRATEGALRALRQLGLDTADLAEIAEVAAFASYQSGLLVHLEFAGENA